MSHDAAIIAWLGIAAFAMLGLIGRSVVVKVGSIEAELKPNGGSSTKDAVIRIEADIKHLHSRMDAYDKRMHDA